MSSFRSLSIALVHHPVLDHERRVVTTAVTSVDIHDLARSACTYGVDNYYLVHPIAEARRLVEQVRLGWLARGPSPKNLARQRALGLLRVVASVDEARGELGADVEVWSTSARAERPSLTFREARERLGAAGGPVLLLFGTGNGLAPELSERCNCALEPILAASSTGYNHLSVRSAVAIALDRLRGA